MLPVLETMRQQRSLPLDTGPEVGVCTEKNRLWGDLLRAIQELNALLSEQTKAVIDGDPEFSGFDVLLHIAQVKKEQAKYRWIEHVEAHHC